MRHFLQQRSVLRLAVGMAAAPVSRALMARSGSSHRLLSCLLGAALRAVDLSVLAVPAQQRHTTAARTPVHAQRRVQGRAPSLQTVAAGALPLLVKLCVWESHGL